MATASSAEVQMDYGRYNDTALAEPVVLTQDGKPCVVILAATEYERLKELDRRILRLDDMSDAETEEMIEARIPVEQQYSLADIPD
jgi:PHD/YefM family antitoxin component YafN of YafNO toxin-antitoxin module